MVLIVWKMSCESTSEARQNLIWLSRARLTNDRYADAVKTLYRGAT